MHRVPIVGCGASGKTHLAHRLAALLSLPVTHLDAIHYDSEWNTPDHEEFAARRHESVAADRWITEGNYAGTLPIRLHRADTMIFLDLPALTCPLGVLQRRARYRGGQHHDGVHDRITLDFLTYIGSYRTTPWGRAGGYRRCRPSFTVEPAVDPGRRFDDLFNFVHDPATLIVTFDRAAGNRGARTPGVDGMTATDVEELIGVPGFLDDLRTSLKDGSFRPLPVRERKIPTPGGSGKVRRLGIPTVTDRVVQAALELVLEPICEADFEPVSYGFRPNRRAQDAILDRIIEQESEIRERCKRELRFKSPIDYRQG